VSVKVGNDVGHICVLSARARACPFCGRGYLYSIILYYREGALSRDFESEGWV
jgi:hypothetical protein